MARYIDDASYLARSANLPEGLYILFKMTRQEAAWIRYGREFDV